MKRILPAFALWLIVTAVARAHVGSPNVFFEGRAGAYAVYAVIRPPAALPGPAQVSVRVEEPECGSVSFLPVMWQAGRQGSPQPVAAQQVPGETNLWNAEVWFLHAGSYTVQVNIEGPRGSGVATVPVNVIGRQSLGMKPALRVALTLFGLLLLVSAVFIVGAVTREGCLHANKEPTPWNATRGRTAAAIALFLLAASVAAGAIRWRNMDLAYRTEGIQKPEPVAAAVRAEADRIMLELRQGDQSASLPPWVALVPDHGKLMHLFLIREPELNVFAHLHPLRSDGHTFLLGLPALPAGDYQLYGDVTFENGISQTLVARVKLPEPVGGALLPPPLITNLAGEVICGFPPALTNASRVGRDMDDSWHLDSGATEISAGPARVSRLMGGYTLRFENASAVMRGRDASLRFALLAPDGSGAALQPYMGMLGHAAVRRADGSVFAHLHPLGSFSMASQEVFREQGNRPAPFASLSTVTQPTNCVSFPYQFPKTGAYRLWIQIRTAGRVLTGVFDLDINSGS
jgi:hypothetical protein